ncbi:MAG: NAD-dependent epimerase/dehydratase family protein, partial [Myxococcales bacterium]|nr:NAD-dependent epimerase/dehydratase family protein [Myxococcales bacterium]
MKVLLTGATGFIGPHVARALLQAGHHVRALVRPGSEERLPVDVEPAPGDLTVPASLAAAVSGCDAVVHLGGVLRTSRSLVMQRVNVGGTQSLAQAARDAGAERFVFVSTLSAQGPADGAGPHRGPGREAPIEAYGRSKLSAETALRAGEGPRWTTVLRPAVVLGPGDQIINPLSAIVRARIVPELPGLQFSFVDVRDLAALIVQLLTEAEPAFGPFFVAHPTPVPSPRLVDAVERVVSESPTVRVPVPGRLLR